MPHYSEHRIYDQITITDFMFESGDKLNDLTIAYETWGALNDARDNAVLIEHALTGTSHATGNGSAGIPGWWDFLIGPGRAIDTREFFVICSNVPGACAGSSGPASIDPDSGTPYGMRFPVVTVRDMVHAQKQLMDHLGVRRIRTITGASMGAMQAMEWAALYPDMVESIIPISAPGRAYPQSIALRKSQRKAIMNDPDWRDGDYYGHSAPARGLELARFIGFITYRSEPEFAQRFGRDHRDDSIYDIGARFEIESYLEHHGKKLATWFDANTYLYLSKAMDLHDMGRGRDSYEDGIQRIRSKVLVIGVDSDILFPCYQQKEFVDILGRTNPNVKYHEMQSLYGHDAFLVEEAQVSRIIRDYVDAL